MRRFLKAIIGRSHYIDQISFVLLNFIMVFLASEILTLDEGADVIWVLSISALLLTLSTSLIVTPLVVFWQEDSEAQKHLLSGSYLVIAGLAFIFLICLVLYAVNFRHQPLHPSAIIFTLLYTAYDFSRRSMYVLGAPNVAAIVSLLCLGIFCAAMLYCWSNNSISEYTIFISASIAFFTGLILLISFQIRSGAIEKKPSTGCLKIIVNKQFSYAKFGICSSFIIWLVTSGPFVFLERYIPQEEYIASRVYLSVTGIISVLLVAIENKVLPTLSKLLKTGQKSSLALEIKQLNVSLFKIAATGSIACIVTVILAFPGTHNYIQIGLSYLAFQYFLCLSRRYTFIAKIKLKQANMLLVNIASLIIVLLALPFYMIETPAFIAANCSLTYAVSLFIIFYILDRTKRTYT